MTQNEGQIGYDSFGNFSNNGLGKTTLVPNQVTEIVAPSALGKGPVVFVDGYIQSANYVTGVSGWRINASGDAEFSSGTFRLDLIGNTYKTVSTLPTSGSGLVLDSTGFHAYSSGNLIFDISGSVISFLNTSGVSSATIAGLTASELDISIANGGGLQINSSYLAPSSATMTIGDAVAGIWTDSYVTKYHFGTSSLVFATSGSGSPNGAVTASPGALYVNTSGGAGTTLYVKESGSNTNTGWVAK